MFLAVSADTADQRFVPATIVQNLHSAACTEGLGGLMRALLGPSGAGLGPLDVRGLLDSIAGFLPLLARIFWGPVRRDFISGRWLSWSLGLALLEGSRFLQLLLTQPFWLSKHPICPSTFLTSHRTHYYCPKYFSPKLLAKS